MTSSTSTLLNQQDPKETPRQPKGMQKVFKAVCITLFLILIFCIPGFLKFRYHCQSQAYHVFSTSSLKWCVLGFFLIFVNYILILDSKVFLFILDGDPNIKTT